MKLPRKLERAIDVIGLFIALLVDLIVIPICMAILAPDFLTKVAFVCIGVTIVLFVFRSWAKGQKKAWFIFAAVVFFFDYSFAIVMTQAQTEKIESVNDTELVRIDSEIFKAQEQILKLREERTISTRPETIASISKDIETEEQNVRDFKLDRTAREKTLEKTGGVYITADSVFTSIPDAIQKKRYIPLMVFGLIFLGLQAVVITSIDAPDKVKKEEVKPEVKKPGAPLPMRKMTTEIWVRVNWAGEKLGKPRIPSEALMIKWALAKGIDMPLSFHQKHLSDAVKAGLVSAEGMLLKNEERALEVLKGIQ
jgi:hypothetical protein